MDPDIRELVQTIHSQPGRTLIVTAGAGTQALAWLLGVAGASRTLLEALIPYDEASFIEFLGHRPEQHVSESTARLLSGQALRRAKKLCDVDEPLYGVACTATIVTDRPKKGQHRAHISIWTDRGVSHSYIKMKKGVRKRQEEEELVSRIILNSLAKAMGINRELTLISGKGDQISSSNSDLAAAARELMSSETSFFELTADGHIIDQPKPKVILSGAFNPLHKGHLKLAEAAAGIIGQPVKFEIAAVNADKGKMSEKVVLSRLAQFAGSYSALVSTAPTFLDKARLYPQSIFVIGYDTAIRIFQPRYYNNSRQSMLKALMEIRDQGCQFLVAGRTDETGYFNDAANLVPPEPFADLFVPIPAERFRFDLSSTKIRTSSD